MELVDLVKQMMVEDNGKLQKQLAKAWILKSMTSAAFMKELLDRCNGKVQNIGTDKDIKVTISFEKVKEEDNGDLQNHIE